MGRKSEQDEGTFNFFKAISSAFFQAGGKTPFFKDSLKSLTKRGPIVGRDLAITI